MKLKAYWKVVPCDFPIDGYLYNVQEWRSVDEGDEYYYCGIGSFCKTIDECCEYIKMAEKRLEQVDRASEEFLKNQEKSAVHAYNKGGK